MPRRSPKLLSRDGTERSGSGRQFRYAELSAWFHKYGNVLDDPDGIGSLRTPDGWNTLPYF